MAVMGAIYFWYPKMFGRMMSETLGKLHFFLTFIFLNGTFFTMHILGAVGFPRRLADPYPYKTFEHLQPMNVFMTFTLSLVAYYDNHPDWRAGALGILLGNWDVLLMLVLLVALPTTGIANYPTMPEKSAPSQKVPAAA